MSSRYFIVSRYPTAQNPTDIGFQPVGEKPAPIKYLELKSDIEKFVSVINGIYKNDDVSRKAYYERIYYLAELGFSDGNDDFLLVSRSINDLKESVVSASWSKIRNNLLLKYGISCIVFIILFSVVQSFFNETLKNIPVVLAGSCVGSWLSFALRTKNITFNDVYSNFCDGSSPFIRASFITILTLVAVLLFQSGLIQLDFGGLSTTNIHTDAWLAFSVGSLLGFGELTLASSLTKGAQKSLSEKV